MALEKIKTLLDFVGNTPLTAACPSDRIGPSRFNGFLVGYCLLPNVLFGVDLSLVKV
jgi:hypothetical protein